MKYAPHLMTQMLLHVSLDFYFGSIGANCPSWYHQYLTAALIN